MRISTATATTPTSPFALRRALAALALDHGDWAVASGLVEHHDDADAQLDHVAEAVEIAARRTGLAEVRHWRVADVQAVVADQRHAPAWSGRAVLCALRDFLCYLDQTGQWAGSDGELRRCVREVTLALRALQALQEH